MRKLTEEEMQIMKNYARIFVGDGNNCQIDTSEFYSNSIISVSIEKAFPRLNETWHFSYVFTYGEDCELLLPIEIRARRLHKK